MGEILTEINLMTYGELFVKPGYPQGEITEYSAATDTLGPNENISEELWIGV